MLDISHLCKVEVEQALLGAFFVKPALVSELMPIIAPGDFSEPLHQKIHTLMIRLVGEGRPLTPITLGPYFENEESVGDFTVPQYLGRLLASAIGTLHAAEYARMVREFAARRALHETGNKMLQFAGDMERTPGQAAGDAISALDGIITSGKVARASKSDANEAASKLIDDLENGTGQVPVPTGLADLDDIISGFTLGDYHILAGRPSMGKTALAEAFALNAARRGFGTMFFSLEMRTEAIMARMLSDLVFNSQTPVPYRDILRHKANPKRNFLNAHQIWQLKEAKQKFENVPLVIDDQSNLSVTEIAARARRQAGKFEEKGSELKLIVIDHKDFIRPSARYSGNKVAETGEVSAALKSMFKELNVAGLLLCQLSRDVEKRDNKRPSLPDLRWAGDLEQDADLVMFSYREAYYLERSRLDNKAEEDERVAALKNCTHNFEVIIGKQRNGPCTVVDLWADIANNAIRNAQKRSERPYYDCEA